MKKLYEHVEVAAVKSCNLTCKACNHLSPTYKTIGTISPEHAFQDLSLLSKHIHAQRTWILGGEPLLHPDIVGLIRACKKSGISNKTQVLTNGTLLGRMSEEFWKEVDLVKVSLYPGVTLDAELVKKRRSKLYIHKSDVFFETFSTQINTDEELVRKIYRKCTVMDKCVGLVNRHFYRCMRSSFISEKVPHPVFRPTTIDGVKIEDTPEFEGRLREYLSSKRIPVACSFCLGNSGKTFPHTQPSREGWMDRHSASVQEMVDPKKL